MDRHLAPGGGGSIEGFGHLGSRGQARDYLDQRHHRRGIEEVQAGNALGALEAGGDGGDRQRRGVAGQQGVGAAQGLQLGEQLALDRQVLDDGLHHQAAVGQLGQGGGRAHAGDDGVDLGLGHLALGHTLLELAAHAVDAGLCRAGAVVVQAYRMAGLGRHLGDASAHGAGADHGDAVAGCEG